MKRKLLNITPFAAIEKMKKWCAYQERSQNDARQKLYEFGIRNEEAESIIAELISENYLNQERFAMALASGKFRIKRWGKIKIKNALKQHEVSDYCIQKALASLESNDYENTLAKVIEKKLELMKSGDKRKKYYSALSYAVSKGFERDLVMERLNVIFKEE